MAVSAGKEKPLVPTTALFPQLTKWEVIISHTIP